MGNGATRTAGKRGQAGLGSRLLPPRSKLPKVIPPRSFVLLFNVNPRTAPEWVKDRARVFRIGYYNREDGLDCIWLVNDAGEYEQTVDRRSLLDHFIILKLSDERDLFGDRRAPMKPLDTSRQPASAIPAMIRA